MKKKDDKTKDVWLPTDTNSGWLIYAQPGVLVGALVDIIRDIDDNQPNTNNIQPWHTIDDAYDWLRTDDARWIERGHILRVTDAEPFVRREVHSVVIEK